jgi:hypothetical protein
MPVRSSAKSVHGKPVLRSASGAGNAHGSKVHGDKDRGANGGSGKKGKGSKRKRGKNSTAAWTPERRAEARRLYYERNGIPDPQLQSSESTGLQRTARPAIERDSSPADGPAEPTQYQTGFIDDEYQDAGVRGRVFICGLPGSGKSQLLCDRIRGARRVIVFDPVKAKTLESLTGDGFVQVGQPQELRELLARQGDSDFRVLYTPVMGQGVLHFEAVNDMVYKVGGMVYAIDEVDKFQEPASCPPRFYELVNYCRHREIAMIGTARRPAQVSKEYTYGLSEVCAFNVTEPRDLKYFEGKCGSAATERLPQLGKYAYLRWMQDGRISEGNGWQ